MSRESILKQYLEPLKKEYDFIILDCMPSLGMLTVNALAASDQLINLYGAGNVSTCGFSSSGALAIGIVAYNNTMKEKLPMPRHIVAVSETDTLSDYWFSIASSLSESRISMKGGW